MTKQVQLRRGTTAEHTVFTGAVGELTIDTTRDIAIVHDGVKVGGHELVGVAATAQSIVNKDGVGIGTTNARSPLTVIGDSFISGVSTFTSGVGTDGIGIGGTVVYVDGNARVIGTLSVGSSTITLNGDTNTISVENISAGIINVGNITVNRIDILGIGLTIFSLDTATRGNISSGSSIIALRNITNVAVGDSLSIPSYLSYAIITGVGTVGVTTAFNAEILSTTVSSNVGIGSTIIALNSISGVSIGNSVSIGSSLTNVPIVGFTTVSLNLVNQFVSNTSIASTTLISDTIIAVGSSESISIGNSFSVSGIVTTIPIIGISTVTVTAYQSLILSTTVSSEVGIGSTTIPVDSTA